MKMKKFNTLLLFFCFFIFYVGNTFSSFAQPGDPGGDPDVPISGIEILLVIGGALGFKKLIGSKRFKK